MTVVTIPYRAVNFEEWICSNANGKCWKAHFVLLITELFFEMGKNTVMVLSVFRKDILKPIAQVHKGMCSVTSWDLSSSCSTYLGSFSVDAMECSIQLTLHTAGAPKWTLLGLGLPLECNSFQLGAQQLLCPRAGGGLVPEGDLLWGTGTEHKCDLYFNDQLTGKLSKENA